MLGLVFDYSNEVDLKNYILELYSNYKLKKNNFKPKDLASFSYENLSEKLDGLLNKTIN